MTARDGSSPPQGDPWEASLAAREAALLERESSLAKERVMIREREAALLAREERFYLQQAGAPATAPAAELAERSSLGERRRSSVSGRISVRSSAPTASSMSLGR